MRVTITNKFAKGGQTTRNFEVNNVHDWLNNKIPQWIAKGYQITCFFIPGWYKAKNTVIEIRCYNRTNKNRFHVSSQRNIDLSKLNLKKNQTVPVGY